MRRTCGPSSALTPHHPGGYEVHLDSAFGKSSSQVHEHPFHATESERRDKERNETAFEPEVLRLSCSQRDVRSLS